MRNRRWIASRRRARCLTAGIACVIGLLQAGRSWTIEPRPVPGRVLLQFHDWVETGALFGQPVATRTAAATRTGIASLDTLAQRYRVTAFVPVFPTATRAGKAELELSRFFCVDFPAEEDLETVRLAFASDPNIALAEYDWMHPLHFEPNDSGSQWHIESPGGHDAHLTGGWNHSQGDPGVVIGILDSGVDWRHPDLGGDPPYASGNIYVNTEEFYGTTAVDDDGNGYVDDIHGWDFVAGFPGAEPWPGEDAAQWDNDPSDFNGHGTHVAGIAGAITNNARGVAGAGFHCRILPLRIGGSVRDANGNEVGVVYMSAAATAIEYARDLGVAVLNCSWGSTGVAALQAAVNRAVASPHNIVFTVSAGNNDNELPSYLASRGDCIDVAATNRNDIRASFSSYGEWVDVSAPGVDIVSTWFDHRTSGNQVHAYRSLNGTSMSAPLVAGVAALLRSRFPALDEAQIRIRIASSADGIDDRNPAYAGRLGGGRVNALKAFGDRLLSVPDDYPSITKALTASAPNDTIALRGGITLNDMVLVNRNARYILGSWNADYTARDLGTPTILVPILQHTALEIAEGVDSTLVISGLVLRGGIGRELSGREGRFGGGVFCRNASPTFIDCDFDNNLMQVGSYSAGGGGYFENSAARLLRCRFNSNAATDGSGAYLRDATLTFVDCSFVANTTHLGGGLGAGICVEGGDVHLLNCRIEGNAGATSGGGVYVSGAQVVLEGVSFATNSVTYQGGGLAVDAGSVVQLRGGRVRGCGALVGGGAALLPGGVLTADAVVWSHNRASAVGGAVYGQEAQATLTNCTWDANVGGPGGGDAILASNASAAWRVSNSIVSNHARSAFLFSGSAVELEYNLYWNNQVLGTDPGLEALQVDPRFVASSEDDYELGVHSPAIDSGDPATADRDGSRSNRGAFGGSLAGSRAPKPPLGLQVSRPSTYNEIRWSEPSEAVAYYVVYRGAGEEFKPAEENWIGTVAAGETTFADPDGRPGDWYTIAGVEGGGAASGFSIPRPSPLTGTDSDRQVPRHFVLHPNEPNPFNPTTRVRLEIPTSGRLRLEVFDVRGRLVRRLVDANVESGYRDVVWDGRDDAGRELGSGTYVLRARSATSLATVKMILVR